MKSKYTEEKQSEALWSKVGLIRVQASTIEFGDPLVVPTFGYANEVKLSTLSFGLSQIYHVFEAILYPAILIVSAILSCDEQPKQSLRH